jgi:hypothetical protein
MTAFKEFIWRTFYPVGWYFVAIRDRMTLVPMFWNGVVWETRVEVIDAKRIYCVLGRIPE